MFRQIQKNQRRSLYGGIHVGKRSTHITSKATREMGNPQRVFVLIDTDSLLICLTPTEDEEGYNLSQGTKNSFTSPQLSRDMPNGRYILKGRQEEGFIFEYQKSR